MLANLPEKWFASRVRDQFGRPVARSHQRIEPFQHSHAWPLWPGEPVAPCTELLQALLIGVHALACLLRAVNSLADSQDILPDIVQPVRGEGDNARAQAGDLRVNLSTAGGGINRESAHHRKREHCWWVIAFVRSAHQLFQRAQLGDHLSCACEKRNKPHFNPQEFILWLRLFGNTFPSFTAHIVPRKPLTWESAGSQRVSVSRPAEPVVRT